MQVPDDVILLWSDDKCVQCVFLCHSHLLNFSLDSFGNVRRNPLVSERNRTGGSGVYYHVCGLTEITRIIAHFHCLP